MFLIHTILLGFIGFILLLKYWEWLPVFFLPLIWYLPAWTTPGGPMEHIRIVRWFMSLIVPLLGIIQLGRNIKFRQQLDLTPIALPLITFVLVVILSTMINNSGFLNMIGYFSLFLQYPLFFMVLMNIKLPDRIIAWFIGLFLFLIFIQVPEIIFRYLMFGITGDTISFTLGIWGAYNIGIFSLYAIALITAHGLVTRFRLLHLLAYLLLLICALIGEIKVVVVGAPLIVMAVVLVFLYKRFSQGLDISIYIKKFICGIIILALLLPIYKNWGKVQSNNSLNKFSEDIYTIISGTKPLTKREIYSINRFGILIEVFDFLKKKPLNLLFGLGPGSSFAGNFFSSRGKLLSLLNLPKWMVLPQIPSVLTDIGIVGLIIHLWIFTILLKYLLVANQKAQSIFYESLLLGSFGVWVFYVIVGPIYNIVWRTDCASYIFYFFMAVACKQAMKGHSDQEPGQEKLI